MKSLLFSLALMVFLTSCKNESSSQNLASVSDTEVKNQELSLPQKIASAYGIQEWENVTQLDFSFVVIRGQDEFVRRWSWQPKTGDVTLFSASDTIAYNRKTLTEELIATDKAFINDSFWLLFPFHLVWDDVEILTYEDQTSPLLKQTTTKLRVNYPSEGGYTPGDSYEVYVDNKFNIVEWTYHRGGAVEPNLGNTFENQQSFNGIKIDMEHANAETGFQLNFRDVVVK